VFPNRAEETQATGELLHKIVASHMPCQASRVGLVTPTFYLPDHSDREPDDAAASATETIVGLDVPQCGFSRDHHADIPAHRIKK